MHVERLRSSQDTGAINRTQQGNDRGHGLENILVTRAGSRDVFGRRQSHVLNEELGTLPLAHSTSMSELLQVEASDARDSRHQTVVQPDYLERHTWGWMSACIIVCHFSRVYSTHLPYH